MDKRSKPGKVFAKMRKNSKNMIAEKHSSEPEKSNVTDEKLKVESPPSSLKKKIWSLEALEKAMRPSAEELEYRKEKIKEPDILHKLSKLIKCSTCQTDVKLAILEDKEVPTHPSLGVLMCKECCNYYEDGEFSLDSDGEDKYCRWCGEGGTIFSCSKCICGFCAACLKQHFESDYFKKVQKDEKWLCFFCNSKPLWDHRFTCSVAERVLKNTERTSLKNENKNSPVVTRSGRLSIPKSMTDIPESKNSEPKRKRRKKFFRIKLKRKEESSSSTAIKSKVNEVSSSDDSELEIASKKMRFTSSVLNKSCKRKDNHFENVKPDILKDLKKILLLSKHNMSFGVNWSSKMVEKLESPDYVASCKELVKECQRVKWFLSILSTYLVQFSNSVELIEKVLTSDEEQKSHQNMSGKDESYSNILQFLSFVNNQIHIFKENGLSLPDIMTTEVHNDEKITGLKRNSKLLSISSSININSESTNKANTSEYKIDKDVTNKTESTEIHNAHACDVDKDEDTAKLEEKLTVDNKNKNENEDLDRCGSVFQESDELKTFDAKDDIQEILAILENA